MPEKNNLVWVVVYKLPLKERGIVYLLCWRSTEVVMGIRTVGMCNVQPRLGTGVPVTGSEERRKWENVNWESAFLQ